MEYLIEEAILKLERKCFEIGWRMGDERRAVLMSVMLMLLWQRDSGETRPRQGLSGCNAERKLDKSNM